MRFGTGNLKNNVFCLLIRQSFVIFVKWRQQTVLSGTVIVVTWKIHTRLGNRQRLIYILSSTNNIAIVLLLKFISIGVIWLAISCLLYTSHISPWCRFNPYPLHYRAAFAFSVILYLHTIRLSLLSAYPVSYTHLDVYKRQRPPPAGSRSASTSWLLWKSLWPTCEVHRSASQTTAYRRVRCV